MCDPVSLAITAATALGSSALQGAASKKVNSARDATMQAEQNDLAGYRAKAIQALGTSEDASSRPAMDTATQAAQNARTQDYTAALNPETLLPGQGNASDAVKQQIVSSLSTGASKANQQATNKAAIDAYGDSTFRRNVALQKAGQQINTQGNFAGGRESVLPVQLAADNHAGDNLQTMAGLVQGIGTAAGMGYGKMVAPKAPVAGGVGQQIIWDTPPPVEPGFNAATAAKNYLSYGGK